MQVDRRIAALGFAQFAGEAVQPVAQVEQLRFGLAPTRQLQDVFHHQVHASRVVEDDLGQAAVGCAEVLGFLQQLGGVTDGTERVADFVGDAGGQATEGGQLELLRLLGDLRDVLEEHQDVALALAAQRHEAGLQHRAFGEGLQALRAQGRIFLPLLQALEQRGTVRVEALGDQLALAEQGLAAGVGQQYPQLRVEDQDAGAHALQDQGVERLQVGDVGGVAAGQGFALLQAPAESLDDQRGGKAQGAEGAGLHVLGGGRRAAEAEIEGQVDQPAAGQRGDQQAEAPAQDAVGDRHRDHQQRRQAAGDAAGGVEQGAEQADVEQRQAEQLQWPVGLLQQDAEHHVGGQVGPAAVAEQLGIGHVQQLAVHVAGDQQHQGQTDAEAIEMVQAQDALALLGTRRPEVSAVQGDCPVRGGHGCNTSGCRGRGLRLAAHVPRSGRSAPSAGPWARPAGEPSSGG
ncbi:hypothetical protein D3C75_602470 [compost metagenome]